MQYEPFLRNNLLTLARTYGEAFGHSLGTVGSAVVGDGKFFTRLLDDTVGFTVASYDRAAGRFAALWPETIKWPDGIPRPEPIMKLDVTRRPRAPRENAGASDGEGATA